MAEHRRRCSERASGMASVGDETSTEGWIWIKGLCGGLSGGREYPAAAKLKLFFNSKQIQSSQLSLKNQ